MANVATKKNENKCILGSFEPPERKDSLQETASYSNSEDDDLMDKIEPSQLNLNLDHITPSLFIPSEDQRAPLVREGEQVRVLNFPSKTEDLL